MAPALNHKIKLIRAHNGMTNETVFIHTALQQHMIISNFICAIIVLIQFHPFINLYHSTRNYMKLFYD